jgi:hypothetical protein
MYNAKRQNQGGSTLCMHIFINVINVIQHNLIDYFYYRHDSIIFSAEENINDSCFLERK